GFSVALGHELKGTSVGVTVVHPGGVATAIADNARVPKDKPEDEVAQGREEMNRVLKLPPETAGEIIVRGIERRRARVLVGSDAKIASVIERLMPVSYWKLANWEMKR